MSLRLQRTKEAKVFITPLNENQELNYCVSFTGTAQQIVAECLRIITGLKQVLTQGDFSVKVENAANLDNLVIINQENILDSEYEVICPLEDFTI